MKTKMYGLGGSQAYISNKQHQPKSELSVHKWWNQILS